MIECKKVSFYYKKNKFILNDINLKINKGEIHSILGHNGVGKTTLCKLMVGLLKAQEGNVKCDAKSIGYLPENDGLYKKLTVYQNIKFRAELYNYPKSEIEERINYVLNKLNLEEKKDVKVNFLSNGLKKRVGLACSIITNLDLLLLDEPTNGIDPESLQIIVDICKELNKENTTIICISHNLAFVEEISSNITILNNGKVAISTKLDSDSELKKIYFENIN